ncbi:four-helix bundle copper-binding protein [Superficieibacter electus]|uniref:Four-helix bundle copper-binding protein n=1 Tax=Superficieibacter electus TaxID=2022662 RepID=A0A2P5GJL3_9ENTR|nr:MULTISPECIES: four-helix bundle copper-binding protein [Enterobacteriaceae]POP41525.1 four-helix bundle copper-binding protein [Superficieibacter electus]POP43966.1 four-helix bundle copper-binding protein [Superficieibacter electus]
MLDEYKKCIETCYLCAVACDNCAASCLEEESLEMMRTCIKLDIQCANICRFAAQSMTLNSDSTYVQELCRLCADVCQKCGDECATHEHEHCQDCSRACHRCAEQCRKMAA